MSAKPIAAWLLILAAWGCQSTPTAVSASADPAAGEPEAPESLLDAAADASGARSSRLYLQAAEQFLNDGDIDAAGAALVSVDVRRLRDEEAARYHLARAAVALAQDDLGAAVTALDSLDERMLREPLNVLLLRAEVLTRQGRPAAAAEALTAAADTLAAYGSTRAELRGSPDGQRLNDAIWQHLGHVPAFEFLGARPSERDSSGHPIEGTDVNAGWWQLKAQMLQSFTLGDQRRRLATWRAAWPDHPAAVQPPSALDALDAQQSVVARVGLMLPLSGPLSRAGRAVRDGFIATYLSNQDDVNFEVTVYDVAAEPLADVYERALTDGADVLIGPLSKESAVQMNQLNPEVPVLMLNYLGDEPPAPNVLQLGMAIEDEAASLTSWLNDQRVGRLLVFHNDEDWSTRAMQAVSRDWRKPITTHGLRDIRTVTETVGAAMHVAASQERRAGLQELLGKDLEFVPRAREDVDAIVALVSPVEVSALVPALRFHFADNVPVYATSQTIRGLQRQRLTTLNGFHVTELPWFVVDTTSYQAMNGAFELDGNVFASLYALGVDAFRLVERAPLILEGSFRELIGSTGVLHFTANGRIERHLARTVIRNGWFEHASRNR